MAWSAYQFYVLDNEGNVIPNATVTVTLSATGAAASLASNVSGTAKANPFTADSSGLAFFYAAGGRYNIVATDGTTTAAFTDVLIGSAQGTDTGVNSTNVPTVADGNTLWQAIILNNYDGGAAPTVTDDEQDGYAPGSLWADTGSSPVEIYVCIDATAGAAVWVSTALTAGDLGTMAVQDASNVSISGGAITGIAISGLTNDSGYLLPADRATANLVTISGNTTLDSTYKSKTLWVTANAVITLPVWASSDAGYAVEILVSGSYTVSLATQSGNTVRGSTTKVTGDCAVVRSPSTGVWAAVGSVTV